MRLTFHHSAERAEILLSKHPLAGQIKRVEQQLLLSYLGQDHEVYQLIGLLAAEHLPLIEFTRPDRDLEGLFMNLTEGKLA